MRIINYSTVKTLFQTRIKNDISFYIFDISLFLLCSSFLYLPSLAFYSFFVLCSNNFDHTVQIFFSHIFEHSRLKVSTFYLHTTPFQTHFTRSYKDCIVSTIHRILAYVFSAFLFRCSLLHVSWPIAVTHVHFLCTVCNTEILQARKSLLSLEVYTTGIKRSIGMKSEIGIKSIGIKSENKITPRTLVLSSWEMYFFFIHFKI